MDLRLHFPHAPPEQLILLLMTVSTTNAMPQCSGKGLRHKAPNNTVRFCRGGAVRTCRGHGEILLSNCLGRSQEHSHLQCTASHPVAVLDHGPWHKAPSSTGERRPTVTTASDPRWSMMWELTRPCCVCWWCCCNRRTVSTHGSRWLMSYSHLILPHLETSLCDSVRYTHSLLLTIPWLDLVKCCWAHPSL